MGKITLDRDFLLWELEAIENAIVNVIEDQSRWSIHHMIVFEYDGKFYKTYYSEGATETQDESPWDYEKEVDCYEVELKEVTVKDWVLVKG